MKLSEDVNQEFSAHLNFLREFMTIPTASSGSGHQEDWQKAAQWVEERCREAGLNTETLLDTDRPAVIAHTELRQHVAHVFLYGHYDENPDGRGKSKELLAAHLCALRALHLVAGYQPVNLTILIEGDRNSGSPNLEKHLKYLVRNRAPFDIGLLALEPDQTAEDASAPKLPPDPYQITLSHSERVLLEAAEAALPGVGSTGCLVEPFHSMLGVKALVMNFSAWDDTTAKSSPQRFISWIQAVAQTLNHMAEGYQAYRSEQTPVG